MLIEDTLADIGCSVAGTAARLDEAMNKAAALDFDLVLLSQKAAFGGFENHIWRRFPLERRGLGWVSTKRRILNRGLRAMSRGL